VLPGQGDTAPPLPPAESIDTRILCPCACGRRVHPVEVVDVRPAPVEVTEGREWACGARWPEWLRQEKISRTAWLQALGAPPDELARSRARGMERDP
jgi:hypothetical protein